jgi:hypothetical protein
MALRIAERGFVRTSTSSQGNVHDALVALVEIDVDLCLESSGMNFKDIGSMRHGEGEFPAFLDIDDHLLRTAFAFRGLAL